MGERRIPETLEEAYRLRDTADSLQERDFYQEQVYHLRREEYRSRGIRTEISSRRRGAVQAQLPGATQDGQVSFRSVLPLAGYRACGGGRVQTCPPERA